VLDVFAAGYDAWQLERSTAEPGDGFRFALLQIAGGRCCVIVLRFHAVAEEYMRQFVKARKVR
jgi:hypothetical protein